MQNVEIRKFKKVLVANRGEIAIRVYRALNELGIQTVGIFSKEDKYALFRTKTDEAYMLNPEKGPLDAYLDIKNIIKIATALIETRLSHASFSAIKAYPPSKSTGTYPPKIAAK